MPKTDVIIVGAGPAGCAAAWDLLEQGFTVQLLDKASFPRFKPCAGGLTPKALHRLRYSVAPVIRQTTNSMAIGYKGRTSKLLTTAQPVCALTVRAELDLFCFEQTLGKGASFEQIGPIKAVHQTHDQVTLELENGRQLQADYLIGADGAHSRIRKLTGQFTPDVTAVALEGTVPREQIQLPAAGQLPHFTFDFGVVPQGYAWLFPKGDHVNVGLYTRRPDLAGQLGKQALRDYVAQTLGSTQVDQLCGFPIGTGGEFYQPGSERVFLVGDAAGMAEPLLGEGLHNAIKSGQCAAASLIQSRRSNRSALELYREQLQPVTRDAYNCRRLANAFYRLLPVAYQVIKYPPVATIAMHGFAAGLTVTQCKQQFFAGQLRPSGEPPASLK